jgi:hypothetical protein
MIFENGSTGFAVFKDMDGACKRRSIGINVFLFMIGSSWHVLLVEWIDQVWKYQYRSMTAQDDGTLP